MEMSLTIRKMLSSLLPHHKASVKVVAGEAFFAHVQITIADQTQPFLLSCLKRFVDLLIDNARQAEKVSSWSDATRQFGNAPIHVSIGQLLVVTSTQVASKCSGEKTSSKSRASATTSEI
jgi:hypothetical protein